VWERNNGDKRMNFVVSVCYTGKIELDVTAPDQDTAEEVALNEIESWSEALFIERLDLEIEKIEFQE
jgi:hypothetical protein